VFQELDVDYLLQCLNKTTNNFLHLLAFQLQMLLFLRLVICDFIKHKHKLEQKSFLLGNVGDEFVKSTQNMTAKIKCNVVKLVLH